MYTIYQTKKGDTLETIAQKFNIPLQTLAMINGLMITSSLPQNTNIIVPKEENQYFSEYIVKTGDNIYKIAQDYNITPQDLLRLNGLNETDIIYPNQTITVPKPNVKICITKQDDTLSNIINKMQIPLDQLLKQNQTIYLTADQLIVYKK